MSDQIFNVRVGDKVTISCLIAERVNPVRGRENDAGVLIEDCFSLAGTDCTITRQARQSLRTDKELQLSLVVETDETHTVTSVRPSTDAFGEFYFRFRHRRSSRLIALQNIRDFADQDKRGQP